MKLSALPKIFGLAEQLKKGYFPHIFNTPENENYIGPYPDRRYFTPELMGVEERVDFLNWYAEVRDKEFNLRKELREYCVQDVNILREACMKFREIFLQVGSVDPFTEGVTIASTCSRVFRKNFLRDDCIGLIPHKGYTRADTHSQKAIEWLLWEEKCRGCAIIHAGRSREYIKRGAKGRRIFKNRRRCGNSFSVSRLFFPRVSSLFPL